MIIAQTDPSPGVISAELDFPADDYLGTGAYKFTVKAEILNEPRLTITSCHNEPWFAVRAELISSTGELFVMLGPADGSAPHSQGFMLPRYIKDVEEHTFKVTFQDWRIMEATINGVALQAMPLPTEVILIHHGIEQLVSVCDLLRPNGSLALQVSGDFRSLDDMPLFLLQAQDYDFHLYVDADEIVLRRCGYEIRALVRGGVRSPLWITWSPTQIQLMLPNNPDQTIWSVTTPTAMPPKSLRQLARMKKLQPTTSFANLEAFRTAVHEALCFLQDDVAESGAYNGFWDQKYEGRRKAKPSPKQETDIHRQLLLPLYDWAKMRSVEIIPENETAVGKLDICFVGSVDGQGPVPFCVEVKLAHSDDLEHGLETQLPRYMSSKRAMYGAYVVLWFKGEWFSLPSAQKIHQLRERIIPGDSGPPSSELAELEFAMATATAIHPHLRNIRVIILDVSKPISASKR